MNYYAQLDNNGAVIALTQSSDIIKLANMIPLSFDEWKEVKLLSNYSDGKWIDPPAEAPKPDIKEKINDIENKLDKIMLILESSEK